MQITSYLVFEGRCAEALKFYEKALGGKIEAMMPHKGSPAESHVPPEWADKILHARMTVGEGVLLASDAPPGHYQKPAGTSVCLHPKEPAEAERIFSALSEGATAIAMPIQQTFWARRFAMLTDKFGTLWMINCE